MRVTAADAARVIWEGSSGSLAYVAKRYRTSESIASRIVLATPPVLRILIIEHLEDRGYDNVFEHQDSVFAITGNAIGRINTVWQVGIMPSGIVWRATIEREGTGVGHSSPEFWRLRHLTYNVVKRS